MMGRTHQILGITSGLVTFTNMAPYQYGPATAFAALFLSSFGALIPDLDRPTAKIWSSLPGGKTIGRLVDPLFKHRNFSHSILGVIFFSLLLWRLFLVFPSYWGVNTNLVLICFIVAFFSHLIADMLTEEGVPLLFPLKRSFGFPPRPFQGIRIITGKWFENFVIFPLLNLVLFVMIILKWHLIKAILFK